MMSIIESIKEERKKQDEKWGAPQRNHNIEWLAILGEEYGELCEAVLIWHFGKSKSAHSGRMHDELIQVLSVGVAWLQHLGYDFNDDAQNLQRVARAARFYLEHGEPELADALEKALKEVEHLL